MNKKVLMILGAAILIFAAGTLFVCINGFRLFGPPRGTFGGSNTEFNGEINYNMLKEALNLPEEATEEEVLEALGLPTGSTQEQIREAMREKGIMLNWRDQIGT